MKNIQVIDGADNATFSIFRATENEFEYIFPNPGQDIELVEDFSARLHKDAVAEILNNLCLRPIHKSDVGGIDGTLFFNHIGKRDHLPASKREIDRDPSQINPAQRALYERLRTESAAVVVSSLPPTAVDLLLEVPGGPLLLQWFGGRVPSFHDAEVVTLTLDREGSGCSIRIHTFEMTPDIDAKGFFVLKNHLVVCFRLSEVVNLELGEFNHQNVIDGLSLSRTADRSFRLEMEPCYGLFGFVEARTMSIELEPGKPEGGVY